MIVEWWSTLPFVVLLGCIAVLPLLRSTERAWERLPVKLLVSIVLGVPVAAWFVCVGAGGLVIDALVEYAQFIALLLALFVVSGGVCLTGNLRATPRTNTVFLAVGGVLASVIGTTGAAMLLIRPILNTNKERANKVHTVIFLIFVVANTGGLLTPLGDPPLFLGMLRGVPFTWTLGLWPQWLLVNGLLLVTFYGLDRKAYAGERVEALAWDAAASTRVGLRGGSNLLFLVVVVAAVALVPSVDLGAIEHGDAAASAWIPWREVALLAAAAGSYLSGDKVARFELNRFTWRPILEVAALFVGIFLTMMPALAFLARLAPMVPMSALGLFVFTGGLSAVLDNAPTYATFFELAAQLPGEPRVADVQEPLLAAVSLGAVLGGALTYIGNGPNFMVKSVAETAQVTMPSFGGYVRWSVAHVVPALAAMALLFIVEDPLCHVLGAALAMGLGVRAVVRAVGYCEPQFASGS